MVFDHACYSAGMPIPRLDVDHAALLIIDVQERLLPSIADRDRVVANGAALVRMSVELDIPHLVTEQYVRGLGRTDETITAAMPDSSRRVEKTRFSGLTDLIDEQLTTWQRSSVIVAGIEAHVCVLQTVLDLQASGRQAFVATDAISAGQPDQVGPALDRMRAAGAVPTGVVSAMYEMLGDTGNPAFKACLELAKQVR